MLRLTRQMTTRACVWKSGSLIVEIATFPPAAAWAYEESRKHSRRDAACRVFLAAPQDGASPVSTVLSCRFNNHGCPVGKHFRDALHHFRRVIAGADNRIASDFRRMLQHQIERFGARPLAQIGQQSDIAADNRLQPGSNGS